MKYVPVMGLEIHAELLTKSKIFCSCANQFGGEPNSRVCPICAGFPGTLPILNQEAVVLAVRAGLALNCDINSISRFDRKNYFYPDLPKAYQITQWTNPICTNGFLMIGERKIRINNIHLEEDAGKLIHDEKSGISLADYNRCGIPLIEIVTEPDFREISEVLSFVEQIALCLKYADVCDARLEQGSLRVDVNKSRMPEDSESFGTRAEIKNLNSFKSIKRAIEFEIKRQTEILSGNGRVVQETRRFDEASGSTISMRSKEEAQDYRYFCEPDIPPIFIHNEKVEKIRLAMPEMPQQRMHRYIAKFGLSEYDAGLIVSDRYFSDFYDEAVNANPDYIGIANLMLGELNRCLNESGKKSKDICFSPKQLAELAKMSAESTVSKNAAKEILSMMFESGENPREIAEKNNMLMSNDTGSLEKIIDEIIAKNQKAVEEYKNGNKKVFGFLMGQLMQCAGKSANPKSAKEIFEKKLK